VIRILILAAGTTLWMAAQTIEPAQLKQDLQIVHDALKEGHPGIYRYTAKAEIDRHFARAEARLTRPMTALEFYRIAAPSVGALKCGHTELGVPADVQAKLREVTPVLPVDLRVLDGKIFVYRDLTAAGGLTGVEIRSINGIGAKELLSQMAAVVHGDGDTPAASAARLGRGRFARMLYTLATVESPFRIRYRKGGKDLDVVVEGISVQQLEQAMLEKFPRDKRAPSNATYRFDEAASTGVLKVLGFGGKAEDGKPLAEFFQKVYDDLASHGAKNLIIDVRDNGGGADQLGRRLFSYLVSEPFPYYNDLVINKLTFDFFKYVERPEPIPAGEVERRPNGKYFNKTHPNWGVQQPGKPHFQGKVFALMNGGSFSTTGEFLSTLHHHKRATYIGQEPGAGYYGNTSGPSASMTLPNSKVRITIPLMTYHMAIPGSARGNRGIPVDHTVRYTIDELLAGTDKEMETAMGLIRSGAQ